jgi:hypothetical protein
MGCEKDKDLGVQGMAEFAEADEEDLPLRSWS